MLPELHYLPVAEKDITSPANLDDLEPADPEMLRVQIRHIEAQFAEMRLALINGLTAIQMGLSGSYDN